MLILLAACCLLAAARLAGGGGRLFDPVRGDRPRHPTMAADRSAASLPRAALRHAVRGRAATAQAAARSGGRAERDDEGADGVRAHYSHERCGDGLLH